MDDFIKILVYKFILEKVKKGLYIVSITDIIINPFFIEGSCFYG